MFRISVPERALANNCKPDSGDEAIADGDEAETVALMEKQRCPICQTAMNSYLIDEKRKLHVCGNNPDCSGHVIEGQFRIKEYEGPSIGYDKCASEMQLKTGRFGKFSDASMRSVKIPASY